MQRRTVFLVGGAIATTLVAVRAACARRRSTASPAPDCISADAWAAEARLDEAIAETFPASDPLANTVDTGVHVRPLAAASGSRLPRPPL